MPATGPDLETVLDELLARAAAPPAGLERLAALRGAVVVVKYGGAAMVAPESAAAWAGDLVLLQQAGVRPVVVHGGGPALTRAMERMGVESRFVEGHRVTDADAAEIAEMVLSGRVNKQVVSLLQQAGGRAVGLSGTDAGTVRVVRHRPNDSDIGFVGLVDRVETGLLTLLIDNGYIPVISSTAADTSGQPHNINADVVAGAIAGALGAAEAVFLSDVPGVVVEGEVRSILTEEEAENLIGSGGVGGGMLPKMEAAVAALRAGVPRVHLVDGRARHALVRELLSDHGIGTLVVGS
jgi:acetylglutamate kinase